MSMYAMANAMMQHDLTAIQKLVYGYLICRIETEGACAAGVNDIAADLNVSPRRVMMATRRLNDTRRITVTKRHRNTNLYSMGTQA